MKITKHVLVTVEIESDKKMPEAEIEKYALSLAKGCGASIHYGGFSYKVTKKELLNRKPSG